MVKPSVIKLPNGTIIEVSPDLSPDQITALITAVTSGGLTFSDPSSSDQNESGKTLIHEQLPEEIWYSSKRDRVALFLRNYISENLWFNAKDIQDQQLAVSGTLSLGETSAIGTYLARLFDIGILDRKKSSNGRNVFYRMTTKIQIEYPQITRDELVKLAKLSA